MILHRKLILAVLALGLILFSSLTASAQNRGDNIVFSTTLQVGTQVGPVWDLTSTGVTSHSIVWSTLGTVSSGACALQGSTEITFASPTTVIAPQTVTSSGGPTMAAAANPNYVRMNCTTPIVGTGSVIATYIGVNTVTGATAIVSIGSATISGNIAQETAGNLAAIETVMRAGLPAALGTGGGLKIDGSGTAISISGTVNATLGAETTKVIGVVRNADGSGNLLTSTANALDVNIKSGGGAGGTSSNFSAAFPSAGTAAGFANAGGNMDYALVDGSHSINTNIASGLPTDANKGAARTTNPVPSGCEATGTFISTNQMGVLKCFPATLDLAVGGNGTAGTPSTEVMTMQGISGGTDVNGNIAHIVGIAPSMQQIGAAVLSTAATALVVDNVNYYGDGTPMLKTDVATITGTVNVGTLATVTNPVTVAQSTAANFNGTFVGSKTNNNAAPGATNIGALIALANAAQPTWVEGDQVTASTDLKGRIRTGICDAAGNDRCANVDANNNLQVISPPLTYAATPSLSIGQTSDLQITSRAALVTANDNPCQTTTPVAFAVTTAALSSTVVSAVSGQKVYLCDFMMNTADAAGAFVTVVAGTGTTCGTIGTTFVGSGANTATDGWFLAASGGGLVKGDGGFPVVRGATNGHDLCLFTNGKKVAFSGHYAHQGFFDPFEWKFWLACAALGFYWRRRRIA